MRVKIMLELSIDEKKAYEWALNQQYNSVAAQYAKLLAEALKRIMKTEKADSYCGSGK